MAHTIDLDAYHLVDCFVAYKRSFYKISANLKTYSTKNIIPDPKGTIFYSPARPGC